MRTMELTAESGKCTLVIGESIKNLEDYTNAKKMVIVTDRTVNSLYGTNFPKAGIDKVIEIGSGENAKSLETVSYLYEKFLELELDKSSFIIGIGGGIVCDIVGFAASTYLRAVRFGFVPTTLLAQVDASVGGKNGVNFKGYKNLIGTIRQPEFCLIDFEFLETLPEKELSSGFAEIVKCGAIADASLFSYLENNYKDAILLKREVIEKIVYDSLSVKAGIVAKDEKETALERMKLNFGHTLGHAIEKTTKLPHGEAVSIGMIAAADLSIKRGLLSRSERNRLASLLQNFKLPTEIEANKVEIIDAIRKDKKRLGYEMNVVLLERLGKAKVTGIGIKELEGVLYGSA